MFFPKLILFFIAFLFCLHSYAQSSEHAQLEELDNAEKINSIPSLKVACQKLNHKLLLNVDLAYYFKDCSLHLITDSQLINTLIQIEGKTPQKMSADVYAALPLGSNYTYTDYYKEFPKRFSVSVCKRYNKNIVSFDNYNYYYIESCKKRKFSRYFDVQAFNSSNNPMYAISKYELSLLPDGDPIIESTDSKKTREISEVDLKKNLPDKSILCKNLNKKVTAFYKSFFYVEKCVLFPIKNFSVELQMKAQERGGVKDLTIEQVLGLEEGKAVTAAEVLKRFH